jgi:hypothetical protein
VSYLGIHEVESRNDVGQPLRVWGSGVEARGWRTGRKSRGVGAMGAVVWVGSTLRSTRLCLMSNNNSRPRLISQCRCDARAHACAQLAGNGIIKGVERHDRKIPLPARHLFLSLSRRGLNKCFLRLAFTVVLSAVT